jgi:hypothetical protein
MANAIGNALDAVSARDAEDFSTHCGYHALEQQLEKRL